MRTAVNRCAWYAVASPWMRRRPGRASIDKRQALDAGAQGGFQRGDARQVPRRRLYGAPLQSIRPNARRAAPGWRRSICRRCAMSRRRATGTISIRSSILSETTARHTSLISIKRDFAGRCDFLAEPTVPGTQPLPGKCRKPQCDNVGIDLSRVSIGTLHIELNVWQQVDLI